VQGRGGGGGTTTVTGDPARLTAFADEVTAGIARALAASDAYGTAVRADRAAGPSDLGTTIPDRSPGVARTDLRRVERVGRDLARFGEPSAPSMPRASARCGCRPAWPGSSPKRPRCSPPHPSGSPPGGSAVGLGAPEPRPGRPAAIDNLDGVPFSDHDTANRRNLRAHLRVLEVELAAAERRHADTPTTPTASGTRSGRSTGTSRAPLPPSPVCGNPSRLVGAGSHGGTSPSSPTTPPAMAGRSS
jgi:hypothetical protein